MRFLFDQNISHRILSGLPEDFAGSTSVKREGLLNATDKEIWEFAKANNNDGSVAISACSLL